MEYVDDLNMLHYPSERKMACNPSLPFLTLPSRPVLLDLLLSTAHQLVPTVVRWLKGLHRSVAEMRHIGTAATLQLLSPIAVMHEFSSPWPRSHARNARHPQYEAAVVGGPLGSDVRLSGRINVAPISLARLPAPLSEKIESH